MSICANSPMCFLIELKVQRLLCAGDNPAARTLGNFHKFLSPGTDALRTGIFVPPLEHVEEAFGAEVVHKIVDNILVRFLPVDSPHTG